MKKPDTTIIDQDWPAEELEEVHNCPYCDSSDRTLAYKDVQDWSFYCAPGKWTYWDCTNCQALYLSPRPKEEFIYKAYASYYTHGDRRVSVLKEIKEKIRNECYSHWLDENIEPRLNMPKWAGFFLKIFNKRIKIPFDLEELASLPKGRLLDVGCGSGGMLLLAKKIGFNVTGIEIDSKAVAYARLQGLNIIQGSYKELEGINEKFDSIICSHILEHIYRPWELLDLLVASLNSGGVILLSLPNANSDLLKKFKTYWRGLEAPRHIAIPSLNSLKHAIEKKYGIQSTQIDTMNATFIASKNIEANNTKANLYKKYKLTKIKFGQTNNSDFIQLIIMKNACKSNQQA